VTPSALARVRSSTVSSAVSAGRSDTSSTSRTTCFSVFPQLPVLTQVSTTRSEIEPAIRGSSDSANRAIAERVADVAFCLWYSPKPKIEGFDSATIAASASASVANERTLYAGSVGCAPASAREGGAGVSPHRHDEAHAAARKTRMTLLHLSKSSSKAGYYTLQKRAWRQPDQSLRACPKSCARGKIPV
jgi:hypothetical protein